MQVLKSAFKAVLLYFSLSAAAYAEDYWSYCWNDASYVKHCYGTLAEAENGFMTRPVNGGAKIKQGETWVGSDGRTWLFYDEITVAPIIFTAPEYRGDPNRMVPCAGNASPSDPCTSEAAVFQAYQTWYTNYYGAAIQSFEQVGAFRNDAPGDFSQSDFLGQLHYGTGVARRLIVKLHDGRTFFSDMTKISYYGCPTGYARNPIINRAHALPNADPNTLGTVDDLCGGRRSVVIIIGKTKQVASTAANCNPCYPITADKARFETDFQFAGTAFTRVYHSTGQTSIPEIGANWSHNFGDRLLMQQGNTAFASARDASGYLEGYNRPTLGYYEATKAVGRTVVDIPEGFLMKDADGSRRQFNIRGYLTKVFHPDNPSRDVLIEYDPRNRISALVDAQGRRAVFEYTADTASGQLQRIQLPDGGEILYGHDSDGNLTTVTYPDLAVRTYHYHEAGLAPVSLLHLLTGITDENNQRYASFGYDSRARVTSSRLHTPGGTVANTTIAYGNFYDVTVQNDASGQTVHFVEQFKEYPRPINQNAAGRMTYMSYAGSRLSETTDPLGSVTKLGYAGLYLSTLTEAFGTPSERKTDFTYSTEGRRASVTRSGLLAGIMTAIDTNEWTYNDRNQVLTSKAIDPASSESRMTGYTYCEQVDVDAGLCPRIGVLIGIDGPRTDVNDFTVFSYYPADHSACASGPAGCAYRKGDLWKVTNSLNQVVEYTAYDGAGRLSQVKDANNVVTDLEYHARGWLVAKKVRGSLSGSEADDAITRIEYDNVGQVKKTIQPDGSVLNFQYDSAHRLSGISDALGNSETYTLDNGGRQLAQVVKDAGGNIKRSMSRVFDTVGRLQTIKNAANATLVTNTYDKGDNLNLITDGMGRITDQDVDPLSRLVKIIRNQGGINATTQFGYDARDNLTSVVDPKGLTTAYTHNGLNDLVQQVSPDTGTTSFSYDSGGNRLSQLDARGRLSGFVYDVLNRPVALTVPTAAQNVYFDYDVPQSDCLPTESFSAGRVARIRDESGSTRFCYNSLGGVVRKVQATTGGPTLTVGTTHNSAGRLVAMTYPSGAIVSYMRNGNGQISRIDAKPTSASVQVTVVSNVSYLPFGPLNTMTFGNGRALTKTYDADYQIDKVNDSATGGMSVDFTLNSVSNVVTLAEKTNATATATRTFTYDGQDRMTGLKNGATLVQGFTYDATGNRLSKTLNTTTTTNTIAATSHRLTQVGTVVRTYDANGNTAKIGTPAFVYDDRNRLRDYKSNGSAVTRTYRYNGKGERVSKVQTAGHANNRYYTYDAAGHMLGEYLASGARVKEYVWLDDTLVAILSDHDGSTYQFVETDHLGTPRAVIHPSKNTIVWRWNATNTAFGEHAPVADPDANAIAYTLDARYPGQWYDSESKLHYNYFRDYDPATGRYIESDPIGLAGGTASYVYVDSAPLSFSDSSGLAKWTGTVAVGMVQATISVKKVPIKDVSYGRVTFALKGPCNKDGKQMVANLIGKADVDTNNPIFKLQGGMFDVELEDGRDAADPHALVGAFTLSSSGLISAKGTVTVGAGKGTISGKALADITASGIVHLTEDSSYGRQEPCDCTTNR